MNELTQIQNRLKQFTADRDWEKFHSPKNLAMALSVEAAELLEHFQWMTEGESRSLSPDQVDEISMEVADVQIYLINLATKLNIDLLDAVNKKIDANAVKYPANQ